ncbi:peptidoglycan-associated lipoprotein Pal [Shewanella cyperi]|uniref:Peptidoglycan-associated lipoprotein n=1 Tax=Shewanella cyperi TaxID=2814292 RepID=A0A974XQB2_9GAMM|nr:peptidoglycan-associated lipoprotein Pal [Shewanella cyperi]QSX31433.1 peptidoglycan-associated lipoprotein Pal [Shewanella cyperi]QSX42221.1 peptidoglycan-associated lipoprotein Pal [Shewanella cyperi]
MELNKLLKTMLIVVPALALGACSSTDSATDATGGSGSMGGSDSSMTGGVETGGVSTILSPEEQQRQMAEQMRRENIIYFDFDRSEVQGEYVDILNAHGNYLLEHPSVRVLIEGHSDERGTPEYNIALGERRAKAVAKYLQAMGVQPGQISIVSYGEEKPQDMSRSDDGFAKNRRAVLVY